MNRLTAALAACTLLGLPGLIHAQSITSCAQGQVCMSIDGASGGGARIPLNTTPGRAAIAINPADGSVLVRSVGEGVQQCTQVSTTPAITSFTATPSSVTPGTQITLSWTTTNVPTSGLPCQAISGPQEWTPIGLLPSSGSRTIQANGVAPQTLTYGLRCTGSDGTQVTQTTSVSLTSNPTTCSGANAPPDGYGLTTTFLCSLFTCPGGLSSFPPTSNQRSISLGRAESRALQFVANLASGAGQAGSVFTADFFNPSVQGSIGSGTISISRCPHDYGTACRSGPSLNNGLGWTFLGGSACALETGQTYYFNITAGNTVTSGPPGALGSCSEYPCSALVGWTGFVPPKSAEAAGKE